MADEGKIRAFADDFRRIEDEISKDIIGQKDVIHKIIISMIADGNVLLEGLPGTGKTQLVKTVARVMDLSFSRIQFTPDLMPADVTGTNMMDAESGMVTFKKGPVFANIVLADEINRATPKTHSALLEAMQEKTVTAGNTTYPCRIRFSSSRHRTLWSWKEHIPCRRPSLTGSYSSWTSNSRKRASFLTL